MNIEKLEIKINNFKRKINIKFLSIFVLSIFTFFIIFSLQMIKEFKHQKDLLQAEYNRSMYEMVSYIKNINLQLTKLQITNDSSIIITTLSDIWRQSNLAKENLSNLPISQNVLSNTEKFLGQVSDYSYSIMKKFSKTNSIERVKKEEIKSISDNCKKLFDVTSSMYEELNSGKISWEKVKQVSNENLNNIDIWSNIDRVSQIFQDYEGLIYDGAFSEHIENIEPKFLKDKEVNSEIAKEKINEVFKNEVKNIEYLGEINNKISLYNFNVTFNNNLIKNIQISKKGTKIYSILSDKVVKDINITNEEAIKIGKEFLNSLKINNMETTYYYIFEGFITINFAYKQNEVVIYPDLVKVKIGLDDGQICMLETAGYMYNHEDRIDLNPNISLDKAKILINKDIEIIDNKLVVIPTDSKEEILCYEFEGKINDNKCLIYINAKTGKEEKILMLIETPNGILTM